MLIGVPAETAAGRNTRRRHGGDGQEARRGRHACASSPVPASPRAPTDEAYVAAGANITDRADALGCRDGAQGAHARAPTSSRR